LLGKGDVKSQQTSKQELDNIRALIARDLADAGTIAIACSGYRVTARAGRHKITFEAARLAIGLEAIAFADYFETCRPKRNVIDDMKSSVATETEAEELFRKAKEFHSLVEKWIRAKHPTMIV
jgi:hypothetical protein